MKDIQIVQIMGGLGNQMFQYAFARALGDNTKIDISSFYKQDVNDGYTKRKYQLNVFNIIENYASTSEIRRLCHKSLLRKILRLPNRFQIHEQNSCYDASLPFRRNQAYFVGYFQCEKYFKHLRTQLQREFSLRIPTNATNKRMLDKIQSANAISLHVRRGDYVALQHIHGLCNQEYYHRAIEYICKRTENPHFFVFSDDMDWVQKNLNICAPVTYVDINNADNCYFDIELMKHCKHNIVANSSFSWWGAWLNDNPTKIVIAPKTWFANGQQTNIVPDDWIKL